MIVFKTDVQFAFHCTIEQKERSVVMGQLQAANDEGMLSAGSIYPK